MTKTTCGRALLMVLAVCAVRVSAAGATPPNPAYRVEAIAPASASDGEALAVNAGGDVAGSIDGGAFIWHGGVLKRFPGVQYFYFDGPYRSVATALNRYGVAAGHDGNYMPCSMSGLELATAVTFQKGAMQFVDRSRSGRCTFEIDGINDAGVLVGENSYRGFVRYPDGREITIEPLSTRPEHNGTRASAIDNEGRVVGGTTIDVAPPKLVPSGVTQAYGGPPETVYAPDPNGYVIHAFLATFVNGKRSMRDLGALDGFPDTYATALAEDGTVVGYSGTRSGPKWTRVSGPSHAWMWYRGRMTDLGRTARGDSFAYGVNDRGVVVGCAGDDAVRWIDKRMQNLNRLIRPRSGWHLVCARAVNRDGVIVGTGLYGGKRLPFRLVPTR